MLETTIFADYHQVVLLDQASRTDLSQAWDAQAYARRVVAAGDAVAISTARNTDVPVAVEVRAACSDVDVSEYDHAVECDLLLPSGVLLVAGVSDYLPNAVRLPVVPGRYRVLALSRGLREVRDDGLDGSDAYTVILCPSPVAGPVVVRKQL